MSDSLTLPLWYDLHAHFRQGEMLEPLINAHLEMGCAGILAMPNTKPPVGKIFKKDIHLPYWSIEEYLEMLRAAGGAAFRDIIVPLYLTRHTTPAMIEEGAKSGLLRACKYYPLHGTTGAEHSADFTSFMGNGVFEAMSGCGIILCVHGEEHAMRAEDYFSRSTNAEEHFYRERMPPLLDNYPGLKIVAEHLTTRTGAELVMQAGENVTASVTPQHLLYTAGHLMHGLKYHLYCMPLIKFEEDREALRQAVINPLNTRFFAGTDSAPHTKKATACGCAAGCFTGGIAPQMYAVAFEASGADLSAKAGQDAFRNFLCLNGSAFYGLPVPDKTFTMIKEEQIVVPLETPEGNLIPLALGANPSCHEGKVSMPWRISALEKLI